MPEAPSCKGPQGRAETTRVALNGAGYLCWRACSATGRCIVPSAAACARRAYISARCRSRTYSARQSRAPTAQSNVGSTVPCHHHSRRDPSSVGHTLCVFARLVRLIHMPGRLGTSPALHCSASGSRGAGEAINGAVASKEGTECSRRASRAPSGGRALGALRRRVWAACTCPIARSASDSRRVRRGGAFDSVRREGGRQELARDGRGETPYVGWDRLALGGQGAAGERELVRLKTPAKEKKTERRRDARRRDACGARRRRHCHL